MKTISVIGSCVCRDLFEKDRGENYSFHTDIRFSSPISMLSEPVDFIHADETCFKKKVDIVGTNWYKKNLINDINKTAFEALKQRHGEYLVLDLAESRLPLANIYWKAHNEPLVVTNSVSFRGHYKANLSKNIFKDTSFEIVNPLDFSDDFWKKTIKEFAIRLTDVFEEEKIILIKTKPARHYVDANGFLHPYSTPNHFNEILLCNLLLDKLNNYFCECCPHCHIITFPSDAIGSQIHKWGNHPFHYTEIYYKYLLDCVNSIILGRDKNGTDFIYKNYQKQFIAEHGTYILTTAQSTGSIPEINYAELLARYEEFGMLGKKKKIQILFALDKKHFFENLKNVIKKKI